MLYHRRSIRLKNYDYSQAGVYFVTICTHEKQCLFGNILDGEMVLNECGKIAKQCWIEIPEHFPNVVLHEYVIMPNHIHGIIEIQNPVGVRHALPLQSQSTQRFQNQGKNTVSAIIGSYKSAATKNIHKLNFIFAWQRNYYEHIIRNEKSYIKISEYIMYNPINWNDDDMYIMQ